MFRPRNGKINNCVLRNNKNKRNIPSHCILSILSKLGSGINDQTKLAVHLFSKYQYYLLVV